MKTTIKIPLRNFFVDNRVKKKGKTGKMKKLKRRRLISGLMALVWFCVLPSFAAKEDYRKRLKRIDARISMLNGQLVKLSQDKRSLINSIYKLDLQYKKEKSETNKIKIEVKTTQEKISEKETEKKALEDSVQESKDNLRKILRVLYKVGGNTYLKLFVRVDSLDQLYKNYQYFITLINFKSDTINKIKVDIDRLNVVKSQLQAESRRLQDLGKLKEEKMANMKRLKQGKLSLIRKINSDRKNFQQILGELKEEADILNDVISGTKVKSSLKVINLTKIKGRLRWPIDGRVISSFGKKKSTRFDTYVLNNGIKIKPGG